MDDELLTHIELFLIQLLEKRQDPKTRSKDAYWGAYIDREKRQRLTYSPQRR